MQVKLHVVGKQIIPGFVVHILSHVAQIGA